MPPGTGIVHQVNIEYLARVVMTRQVGDGVQAYPDTCVGTDSHTTMVNGLGVLGWGVGGIEAEAAMLGQPVSMLIPRVVGFKLTGEIPPGATATDVVLTITEMLRKHGVVGKFVEFYGEGVAAVPLANRATIGNMSPEFGSTCAIFPIDEETLRYLRLTGRAGRAGRARRGLRARSRASGTTRAGEAALLRVPRARPVDRRPVHRRPEAPAGPDRAVEGQAGVPDGARGLRRSGDHRARGRRGSAESFPASDSPAVGSAAADHATFEEPAVPERAALPDRASTSVPVTLADGRRCEVDHGAVVIASITSCTNTSNPSVMIGAALLAKNAVERGPDASSRGSRPRSPRAARSSWTTTRRPASSPTWRSWASTSSGYGCTTCIGNSGPLPEEVSAAVKENDLAVVSVLSGNRNFEGRINPDVKMNYLASPPLVIAYALAGTMDFDVETEPLGTDAGRRAGLPARHLAVAGGGRARSIAEAISQDMFTTGLRRRLRRRRALAARCRRRPATPSPGTPTRPTSASRRTSRAWATDADAGDRHRRRPGARHAR